MEGARGCTAGRTRACPVMGRQSARAGRGHHGHIMGMRGKRPAGGNIVTPGRLPFPALLPSFRRRVVVSSSVSCFVVDVVVFLVARRSRQPVRRRPTVAPGKPSAAPPVSPPRAPARADATFLRTICCAAAGAAAGARRGLRFSGPSPPGLDEGRPSRAPPAAPGRRRHVAALGPSRITWPARPRLRFCPVPRCRLDGSGPCPWSPTAWPGRSPADTPGRSLSWPAWP